MVSFVDNLARDDARHATRMIDLIAAHDWTATPLGERSAWSATLRIAVDTILASLHPMCLIWGPERILLYNDGYAPILGARHPRALGCPTAEVWPELWGDLEPLIDGVFAGKSVAFRDQPLTMTRNGFPEETWYDFAYSPKDDADVLALTEDGMREGALRARHERASTARTKDNRY